MNVEQFPWTAPNNNITYNTIQSAAQESFVENSLSTLINCGVLLKYNMKAHFKSYAQYKYTVEMTLDIIIPQPIRTWLLLKDSPFDASHILYINKTIKRNVIAFEYSDDAYYFIAWMELLNVDALELPIQ